MSNPRNRRFGVECLEVRSMMAGDAFQFDSAVGQVGNEQPAEFAVAEDTAISPEEFDREVVLVSGVDTTMAAIEPRVIELAVRHDEVYELGIEPAADPTADAGPT